MTLATLGIDAYQLTTLVAHADEGRLAHALSMAFFFRRMPPKRNYVVFAGLRQIVDHAENMRIDANELATLDAHPVIGPALASRPALRHALAAIDGFEGEIEALPEGTLAYAGPASRSSGEPMVACGARLSAYTPLLQVKTDMVRAKLLETPWLGFVNHLSMVASKAARVATAARGKPVLEFGQRRTHPAAAVDATYAAYLAGCSGSSNIAALARWGVPASGTMDHFAVQASEREGISHADAETAFFAAYSRAFAAQGGTTMLVDTYDTEAGIRHAVAATNGALTGIRIDSNVTRETVARARELLRDLGAPHARIYVSDGLDESRVEELVDVVDGFGVGENIVCSPDAATGVGAVAKLVVNGYGKITMKVAKGSGKATLPGRLQVYRYTDHDLLALADEATPSGGNALLAPVWSGRSAAKLPSLEVARAHVKAQIDALPENFRANAQAKATRTIVISDKLAELVLRLEKEACA